MVRSIDDISNFIFYFMTLSEFKTYFSFGFSFLIFFTSCHKLIQMIYTVSKIKIQEEYKQKIQYWT